MIEEMLAESVVVASVNHVEASALPCWFSVPAWSARAKHENVFHCVAFPAGPESRAVPEKVALAPSAAVVSE